MSNLLGGISNKLIADRYIINEAVNMYHEGRFEEMKGFIMEYNEHEFFVDLFQYLEGETWRNPRNKFLVFVGMTIQYFKIYT